MAASIPNSSNSSASSENVLNTLQASESVLSLNFFAASAREILVSEENKDPKWLNEKLKALSPLERAKKLWEISNPNLELNKEVKARLDNFFKFTAEDYFFKEIEFLKYGVDQLANVSTDEIEKNRDKKNLTHGFNLFLGDLETPVFWEKEHDYVIKNKEIFLNYVPKFNTVFMNLQGVKIIKNLITNFDSLEDRRISPRYSSLLSQYEKMGGKYTAIVPLPVLTNYEENNTYMTKEKFSQILPLLSSMSTIDMAQKYGGAVVLGTDYYARPRSEKNWSTSIYENLKKYIFTEENFDELIKNNMLYNSFYQNFDNQISVEMKEKVFQDALVVLRSYNPLSTKQDTPGNIATNKLDISTLPDLAQKGLYDTKIRPEDFITLLGEPLETQEYLSYLIEHNCGEHFANFSIRNQIKDAEKLLWDTTPEYLSAPDANSYMFTNTKSKKSNQESSLASFFTSIPEKKLLGIFKNDEALKAYLESYPFLLRSMIGNKKTTLSRLLDTDGWREKILKIEPALMVLAPVEYLNNITDKEFIKTLTVNNLDLLPKITNPLFFTRENLIHALIETTRMNSTQYFSFDKKWLSHAVKQKSDIKSEEFFLELLATCKKTEEDFDSKYKNVMGVEIPRSDYANYDNITPLVVRGVWDKVFDAQPLEKLKSTYTAYVDYYQKRLLKTYSSDKEMPILPVRILSDVDYCLSLCKNYPSLDFRKSFSSKLLYSRKFSMFLVEEAVKQTRYQDLQSLKTRAKLPSPIIEFFEKAGIEKNCLDFLHTYFEKKDLKDAITPNMPVRHIQSHGYIGKDIGTKHSTTHSPVSLLELGTVITQTQNKPKSKKSIVEKNSLEPITPIDLVTPEVVVQEIPKVRKFKL